MKNLIKPTCCILLTFLSLNLLAGPKKEMPEWATAIINSAPEAPQDTGVWVLLDQTVISNEPDGFSVQRRVVKKVLRNWGTWLSDVYAIDGDEETTEIIKLKGWHQKASGKIETLDEDNVIAVGTATIQSSDQGNLTIAYFDHVARGSVVVFESQEKVKSYFPHYRVGVLMGEPIYKREIRYEGEGKLTTEGLEGWKLKSVVDGNTIRFENLPALRSEAMVPTSLDLYPRVSIKAKRDGDTRLDSWDNFAKWYADIFLKKALSEPGKNRNAISDEATVTEVAGLTGEIRYRQRYLSYGRGYEPLSGAQVDTLKYGDCKDMTAFVAEKLAAHGAQTWPALCGINDAVHVTKETSPTPLFNHVITAISLSKSLALSAEVVVDGKRYLLYDPTDKFTPIGYLSPAHRNRSVMICTADGARWAKVPDDAVEDASLEIDLRNGSINRNAYTLLADLEVGEWGDAYGFRSMTTSDDPWDMERHLRAVLQLPPLVDLQRQSVAVEGGTFTGKWRIRWPDFLLPDLDGLRLPTGITGYPLGEIQDEEGRQNPIQFSGFAPMIWRINVNSDAILTPALEERNWEGPHRAFSFTSKFKYKRLIVNVERSGSEALFNFDTLEEGLKQWTAYQKVYNQWVYRDALLYH